MVSCPSAQKEARKNSDGFNYEASVGHLCIHLAIIYNYRSSCKKTCNKFISQELFFFVFVIENYLFFVHVMKC